MMEARNESFQRLKPACVALSQATLAFSTRRNNGNVITTCLEDLNSIVSALSRRPDYLDQKLADYVFFPLSQVLKASRDLPVRVLELCLQCLSILISKGWRENVTPSLSSQLIIFLSLTCDTSGKTIAVSQVTDELRIASFVCMSKLFESLSLSNVGKSSLTATPNVPSLGHAISVILDGISDGESFEVQSAASTALSTLLSCIEDVQVLSSFFPGIVSSLTKILTPNTQTRRHWKILVQSLQRMNKLLFAMLNNKVLATYSKGIDPTIIADKAVRLDASWANATASQIKVALANVEKLRSHSRPEVRESLADLNLTILAECNDALSNCSSIALETLLVLSEHDSSALGKVRLEALVRSRPAVAETMASIFHSELLSLPRIMQSNDDLAKERAIRQLFSAYGMLASADSDVRLLSRMLGTGIRDSVTAILQSSDAGSKKMLQDDTIVSLNIPQLDDAENMRVFSTPIANHKAQTSLLNCIETRLKTLQEAHHGVSSELVPAIRGSEGDVQIANFWLVLRDLQAAAATGDVLDSFLLLDDDPNRQDNSVREQLYTFSLDVMSAADSDWRLECLALETLAMQATKYKEDFRVELVDVLYPILHHLGSEVSRVRSHAITCLNIVSDACGYSDVKELVVANVDYLVNAVALKLNSFDVSPQGPQVLLMMVKLAGPSLLPYLEDSMDSIFAALEDYHGYPTLVALLFAVLKAIAEEGVKSPQLQLTSGEHTVKSVGTWAPTSIGDLLADIQKQAANTSTMGTTTLPEDVPHRPWKKTDMNAELKAIEDRDTQEVESENEQSSSEIRLPPAPKTYALLLKITQLTQHYLSSASPSLRISLLSLVRTTIPALAKHEDSYLPLINTLWPEVTSRLFDDEPHVVSASLQIIATMCEYAGEFMRSRISSLWPELVRLYRRSAKEVRGEHGQAIAAQMSLRQTEAGYVDVSTRAVWQSLIELLKTVIRCVGIDAVMFDEVLRMLQPLRGLNSDIVATLEEFNADAVWLALYREGYCSMDSMKAEPRGDWQFVKLLT